MPVPNYFDSITTNSAFEQRFKSEKGKSLAELGYAPGSKWGRQHLLACRVIGHPSQDAVLPGLKGHAGEFDEALPTEILDLIEGPHPDHMKWTEHELVHEYGVSLGQTWAALRPFKSPTNVEPSERPATPRQRHQVQHEGFTDSQSMNLEESPQSGGSASRPSSQGSSLGYVEAVAPGQSPLQEDKTVRLVECFIRHVLYYCPPQATRGLLEVVEFRDERLQWSIEKDGSKLLSAVDDGGLSRVLRHDEIPISKEVCFLEAKKCFQIIRDGEPLISDECLAQMTCEALGFGVTTNAQRSVNPFLEKKERNLIHLIHPFNLSILFLLSISSYSSLIHSLIIYFVLFFYCILYMLLLTATPVSLVFVRSNITSASSSSTGRTTS